MLKSTKINMIELYDLNQIVENTYGRPYNFQQQYGCRGRGIVPVTVPEEYPEDYENDTLPEVVNHPNRGVSFKAWLERDPNQPLDGSTRWLALWYCRNFYPSADMVLNDLHKRGLVEAGEYVINIDW